MKRCRSAPTQHQDTSQSAPDKQLLDQCEDAQQDLVGVPVSQCEQCSLLAQLQMDHGWEIQTAQWKLSAAAGYDGESLFTLTGWCSLDDFTLLCVSFNSWRVCMCVCVCVCVLQANNSTNSTEDDEVKNTFPEHLYSQASKASVSPPQLSSAAALHGNTSSQLHFLCFYRRQNFVYHCIVTE